jgi:hypothetical protein
MVTSRETEPQEDATNWRSRKGRIGGAQLGYPGRALLRREQWERLESSHRRNVEQLAGK